MSDVAGSLGIAASCLHRWRSRDLVERGLKAPGAEFESAELAAARRRVKELEEQVKILTKAAAAVEEVVPPKARFALVAELAAEGVSVRRACSMLGVSKSGLYESRTRAPSVRSIRHAWLTDMITAVHGASRGTYGAPRVHAELLHGHGLVVGHNTVSSLMRRAGIAGLPLRRQAKRFPAVTTVEDLVRRNFRREGPNLLWVTDITEHATREGKLYCCAVIDAYSRRVVGWAIDSRQGADLATNALAMAIEARHQTAGVIIHADHGVQGVHVVGLHRTSPQGRPAPIPASGRRALRQRLRFILRSLSMMGWDVDCRSGSPGV